MIYLIWVVMILVGWIAGNLVNYFSDVLPWHRKLTYPVCLRCDHRFPWKNYILWPKRCPNCNYFIGWRSILVEIIAVFSSVLLWAYHPEKLGFWGGLLILIYFGVIVVIDFEHKLILHPVSLAGVILGLGIGTYLHGFLASIFGGVVGFGIMFIFYWLGEKLLSLSAKLRGQSVDDVALGFGDVNLSGILGLILGFPGIILGLFLSIMIGGLVSLIYLLVKIFRRQYHMYMALPYGPFLISGAVIILFFLDVLQMVFK